jgi:hypothetical protein
MGVSVFAYLAPFLDREIHVPTGIRVVSDERREILGLDPDVEDGSPVGKRFLLGTAF